MTEKILYVEDNPKNMLLVSRIIEAEGHKMLEAWDGEAGWELAVKERPALILMDLRLPGKLSGLDLTRMIKDQPELRHIPIIAITAYAFKEVEIEALAAGCDGFLHKPADIQQIRATIRQFLNTPISAALTTPSAQQPTYTFI